MGQVSVQRLWWTRLLALVLVDQRLSVLAPATAPPPRLLRTEAEVHALGEGGSSVSVRPEL